MPKRPKKPRRPIPPGAKVTLVPITEATRIPVAKVTRVMVAKVTSPWARRDTNQLAKRAIDRLDQLGDTPIPAAAVPQKDPAAVALGRRGGLKGGKARMDALTPEQRRRLAKKAARARWGKSPSPRST